MRQFRVLLERYFVGPPRMNAKEPLISHGTIEMKTQASLFFARRTMRFAQRALHRALLSPARMQPHKHVLLHVFLLLASLMPSLFGNLART